MMYHTFFFFCVGAERVENVVGQACLADRLGVIFSLIVTQRKLNFTEECIIV